MQHEQGCNGVGDKLLALAPRQGYQGGSLENEVILSKDEGTGKILYSKADPPLGTLAGRVFLFLSNVMSIQWVLLVL